MRGRTIFYILLVIQCNVPVLLIKVPTIWNESSRNQNKIKDETAPSFEQIIGIDNSQKKNPIPSEYFEYTAEKPQFAIEIAKFHGVPSPEETFSSYPVRSQQQLQKTEQKIYQPNLDFSKLNVVEPISSKYKVFHPYKSEEPALRAIYKDPVLDKIRNDLRNSKHRLQAYEVDAGKLDVTSNEYLEAPEVTDYKKVPQRNIPVQFELHMPQRRPNYYKPPQRFSRDHILNHKFRHPWNQHFVKIKPLHYKPLKTHLQNLRQQHALKFDDEKNEYPQLPPPEGTDSIADGYDIYKKAKLKYVDLRNNVDGNINEAIRENRPKVHKNLEILNNEESDSQEDYNEFVPIKSYAQVRKSETTKHLPRELALKDAVSYDEIVNAPRLKEALKSTKAQIVYTEEGYEDAAYDHAGEQKHAEDHEGHGGYLKEKEISGGKYKIPSISENYEEGDDSINGDKILHASKWENDDEDFEGETQVTDFDEQEQEAYTKAERDVDNPENVNNTRNKREYQNITENLEASHLKNDTNFDDNSSGQSKSSMFKKKLNEFKVPEIDFDSTYLSEKEIFKLSQIKLGTKNNSLESKYPYYLKNIVSLNKDSPLRYAESIKLIPKKTKGGTEFYDSRSNFYCPEVDEQIDPIPENLKNGTNPDNYESDHENMEISKNNPRLSGLGDKIDCFKMKFFGENPLDSPFFKENIISAPEPVTIPNTDTYKIRQIREINFNMFKPSTGKNTVNESKSKRDNQNIQSTEANSYLETDGIAKNTSQNFKSDKILNNYINDVINTVSVRIKRASTFTYEPYKIIRDVPVVELKKSNILSKVSPLIKKLQSSIIIDQDQDADHETDNLDQKEINNHKNIDHKERTRPETTPKNIPDIPEIIDVNYDKRRGEPRYEIKLSNHKKLYSPVEHKKSMSPEDFQARISRNEENTNYAMLDIEPNEMKTKTFDVSKFLPKSSINIHTQAATNKVNTIIKTTTMASEYADIEDDEEDYDEEYNENEKITLSTTTVKPIFRMKSRNITTSTTQPISDHDEKRQKLQLVTRFKGSVPMMNPHDIKKITRITGTKKGNEEPESIFQEKKRKSTKSTLITDSKIYGDNKDDLTKEEVDALIGVKQDMSEYIPHYEKENEEKYKMKISGDNEDDEDYDDNEDDVELKEENDDESDESEEEDKIEEREEQKVVTTEHTRKTLGRTTDAVSSTTESHVANIKQIPVVIKKKIEINNESPLNSTSSNTTKYKQNIQEIEIIKELPARNKQTRKRPEKNLEVLDLYRDENLPKDVNKLGDVEIFKRNFNMNGPKHGGNYRSAKIKQIDKVAENPVEHSKNFKTEDVDASETDNTKFMELDPHSFQKLHGGKLKLKGDYENPQRRNEEMVELINDDEKSIQLHGGNLKSIKGNQNYAAQGKNSNYELLDDRYSEEEDDEENQPSKMHGGNFKSISNGRYTSSNGKLIKHEKDEPIKSILKIRDASLKNARSSAADLLSGLAQAAPLLTTTPAYILDPSKRQYYYVDV